MATVTSKKEKAVDPFMAAAIAETSIDLIDRKPYGGLDPAKTKLVSGKVYLADAEPLVLSPEDNGRMFVGQRSMAEEIIRDRGIMEPLVVGVDAEGECTLQDLISGKVQARVFRGNRRTNGALLVKSRDVNFYEEHVKGKVPIMVVVNPTPEQEAHWRHDHSGQQGLHFVEVTKQAIQELRRGKTEPETFQFLYNSYLQAAGPAQYAKRLAADLAHEKKVEELRQQVTDGTLPIEKFNAEIRKMETDLWTERKKWGRRMIQTASRLANCDPRIFEHWACQKMPQLAVDRGIEVTFELTNDHIEALDRLAREAAPNGKAASWERFVQIEAEEQAKVGVVVDKEEGETGGSTGKSMSRKELMDLAGRMNSEAMASVCRGIAGEMEDRNQIPEVDELLTRYEQIKKDHPRLFLALLSDAPSVAAAYDKVNPATV
jgi:hypothetical protein